MKKTAANFNEDLKHKISNIQNYPKSKLKLQRTDHGIALPRDRIYENIQFIFQGMQDNFHHIINS